MIKKLLKQTIPLLPGYHLLCLLLRRHRPKDWKWLDRVPIKPGILVIVHSKAGDFYMTRPERCSIAKKYFWTHGIREPKEDRIALDLFSDLAIASDVILDIGANSGLFSIVGVKSNPAAQVVAFDILPEAYHVLIDNLLINKLFENVEVRLIGVGARGTFRSPFNPISSEMPSSLSVDMEMAGCGEVAVPIMTLDEICLPRFVGKKVLIKIDVEGTEVDIFSHGLATLSALKPDIVCEVLPCARKIDSYDNILSALSYRKYLITDSGLREFDTIIPDACFKDWLFTARNYFDDELGATFEKISPLNTLRA